MITWQVTGLSIQDAEGQYVDDIGVLETSVGFDLSVTAPGEVPDEELVVTAVEASLWRYLKAHERIGPTSPRTVAVGGSLAVDLDSPTVVVTIPADTVEVGQQYQLRLDATESQGIQWTRTREYRAV